MAKKAKGNRVQVILECTEHKESGMPGTSRYITTKNRKNTTERLELKKYNPILKRVTVHKFRSKKFSNSLLCIRQTIFFQFVYQVVPITWKNPERRFFVPFGDSPSFYLFNPCPNRLVHTMYLCLKWSAVSRLASSLIKNSMARDAHSNKNAIKINILFKLLCFLIVITSSKNSRKKVMQASTVSIAKWLFKFCQSLY